ncbi:hypothetical protein BKA66DRAFT_565520 [Pyrenochaeta sp. MPI-SDFR-AT-0127]|nr:hypothetical protein BKA66DRAFT_565520 [Pyrenochaeta sp. MPI-SDFR-AT-0127]
MKSTIFAATALLSTSYAATATLASTKCLGPTIPTEQFSIEIGTSQPVAKKLASVCGLQLLSASDNIDVKTIQCQAFLDTEGTQPGSAVFTFDEPALIGTNPIQEQSVLCTIQSPAHSTLLNRRQNNDTDPVSSSTTRSPPRSTVLSSSATYSPPSSAAGNSTSSAAPSTIVRTIIATASSGLPTPSGNSTAPSNTGTPSPTESSSTPSPSPNSGAVGALSVGTAVIAAAFAAVLL